MKPIHFVQTQKGVKPEGPVPDGPDPEGPDCPDGPEGPKHSEGLIKNNSSPQS